jgi:hypothetical protein
MTNIKKIGLTALAGSLVATSAFAGAMDVTGSASVKFQSEHESEHTGNNYSMGQTLNFSGSGDLDNGMTISYGYLMTNAALSSSTLKLDMGDMGQVNFNKVQTYLVSVHTEIKCQLLVNKFGMIWVEKQTVTQLSLLMELSVTRVT